MKIKLFAMERTGSNYLRALLEENFNNVTFKPGGDWKHGTWTPGHDDVDLFLITIKNPFSFLCSYLRGFRKGHLLPNHYEKHGEVMDQFISHIRHGKMADNEDFLAGAMTKYNMMYQNWFERAESDHHSRTYFVRYEDLLKSHRIELNAIYNQSDEWSMDGDSFNDIQKEVTTGATKQKNTFDKSYYINDQYMEDLTKLQTSIVLSKTNWSFFEQDPFSYRYRLRPTY